MAFYDRVKSLFQSGRLDVNERFELLREAVAGTMSQFFMVRDRLTDEIFGLKILDREKTAAFESRFKGLNKPSEGDISRAIKHPRIVETYQQGLTTTGQYYLLMEYLEGPVLNALILNRSGLLAGKWIELIRQMAEAIDGVHKAGYIHRDICPRNFICTPDAESIKLIDFGLTVPAIKEFMQPGNRTGTPNFMASEIVRRRSTDQRVDLFAMGVSAYQICTFEQPWPGTDMTSKGAMLHDVVPSVDILQVRPRLNKTLAKTIMRCLAPKPDDRPKSAAAFLHMIRHVHHDEEP